MFICESDCLKKTFYPGAFRSYGKCELCGKVDNCADVPSGKGWWKSDYDKNGKLKSKN